VLVFLLSLLFQTAFENENELVLGVRLHSSGVTLLQQFMLFFKQPNTVVVTTAITVVAGM
jgi:hypothetical protein